MEKCRGRSNTWPFRFRFVYFLSVLAGHDDDARAVMVQAEGDARDAHFLSIYLREFKE